MLFHYFSLRELTAFLHYNLKKTQHNHNWLCEQFLWISKFCRTLKYSLHTSGRDVSLNLPFCIILILGHSPILFFFNLLTHSSPDKWDLSSPNMHQNRALQWKSNPLDCQQSLWSIPFMRLSAKVLTFPSSSENQHKNLRLPPWSQE